MSKIKKGILNKIARIKKRYNEISVLLYIKTNILFFSFILINVINSWLLRIVTMGNLFNIKAIITDLAFVLLVGSFAYLLKPKKQIKILMPLTVIFTLTCIVNAIYFENYVSFASFSLLSTASFLGEMDGSVITSLIQFKDVILIFPVILLPFIHMYLKKHKYYARVAKIERGKKRFFNTIIIGSLMTFITISLMQASDYSRLKKQWNREYLVQRFGIYVYQVNDAINSTQSKFTSFFGYDSAAKKVREFYEEKNKTDIKEENKYTNIFEGKNVIVIHAESIMTHDMTLSFNGEELTPNINRLASEGLFFSNFYPQVSVGTSSDTEFTFNTSLLPSSTGTVFVNYWNRTYEAMPNYLRGKGYYTASMHANNGTFWNRNVMHKTLGYDKLYAKDTYDYSDDSKTLGMGLSDKEFFKQSVEKIKKIDSKNEKYYITLITLTNHTPWDDGDKYGDYTVDYKMVSADEAGNPGPSVRRQCFLSEPRVCALHRPQCLRLCAPPPGADGKSHDHRSHSSQRSGLSLRFQRLFQLPQSVFQNGGHVPLRLPQAQQGCPEGPQASGLNLLCHIRINRCYNSIDSALLADYNDANKLDNSNMEVHPRDSCRHCRYR